MKFLIYSMKHAFDLILPKNRFESSEIEAGDAIEMTQVTHSKANEKNECFVNLIEMSSVSFKIFSSGSHFSDFSAEMTKNEEYKIEALAEVPKRSNFIELQEPYPQYHKEKIAKGCGYDETVFLWRP